MEEAMGLPLPGNEGDFHIRRHAFSLSQEMEKKGILAIKKRGKLMFESGGGREKKEIRHLVHRWGGSLPIFFAFLPSR